MSLLMDALRKAEEAKRKAGEDHGTAEASPAAPVLQPSTPPVEKTPDSPADTGKTLEEAKAYFQLRTNRARARREAQQQSLDAGKPTGQDSPATPAAQTGNETEGHRRFRDDEKNRQSASAVFSAKKPRESRRRQTWTFLGIVLGLPAVAISWWFWQAWSEANQTIIQVPVTAANRGFLGEQTQIAEPLPPSASEVTNPLLDNPVTGIPATGAPTAPENTGAQPTAAAQVPEAQTAFTPISTEPETATEEESSQGFDLQLVRTTLPAQESTILQQAWEHLQLGNYLQARQLYQSVLARSPNNRDALLGMASLNRSENNSAQAQRLYSRLLELNPRDAMARAGLIEATLSAASPTAAEEQLRLLINENPVSAPLHFALGNLYARQGRWTEAQNAYFDALSNAMAANPDSINPDYSFNLAVSLEQLNQLPLAYQYYKQAEAAARFSAAGFEPSVLTRRLQFLEEQLQ